jgi:hypothetical protein
VGVGRWVAVSWLVLLVACSSEPETAADSPSPPAVAASVPAAPSADPLPAVPATSAGSLDSGSVPSPDTFGAGWVAYIDPGAAADGYLGNGAFVRERDGAELVASLIPFGCADVAAAPILPRPQHALEATYRHESGAAAVVVVLAYPDEAGARSLLRELGAVVSACPPGVPATDPAAPYRLGIDVIRSDLDQLRDVRRETGQGAAPARWVEVAVREEARVALAIVEVRPGADEPDPDRLSEQLRAAIKGT